MTIDFSQIYAHTAGYGGKKDPLLEHLKKVGEQAQDFGSAFGAGELCRFLGLLHDAGKVNPEFQSYLDAQDKCQTHRKVPHAVWAAATVYWAISKRLQKPEIWKELSLPICGHHSGLGAGGTLAQNLEDFLEKNTDALSLVREVWEALKCSPFTVSPRRDPFRRELFIRMVFSALVDADYLATEEHFEPCQAQQRGKWPSLNTLWQRLLKEQEKIIAQAAEHPTKVNRVRREVYEECLRQADGPPGVYRLTVPTGGGKTRSSLAFALKHALKNELRRVVVALPYTSIIDQTAEVYRKILGRESLIEHHSQAVLGDSEDQDQEAVRFRLACENWDAPLIVTTTVQLFESLFANRPSRVRKIHNLARSIIVLDEVQTLPTSLLKPTLNALRILAEDFGVSVLLSTATQPAFSETPYLAEFRGLEIREIVPPSKYKEHFSQLKRVKYVRYDNPLSWDELAEEVRNEQQVMVVLNTRKDALALLAAMEDEQDGLFHLSTLLCGCHRQKVLKEVKNRLDRGLPVRLISTQVVETGVDIDFPVVYRAIGPLDRIVQAAGRCNREGRPQGQLGRVVIFEPAEGGSPRGPYKLGLEQAKLLLKRYKPEDLHDPDIYREYFQRLFAEANLDANGIQQYRECLDYPEVARRYQLIEQDTVSVVVSYEEADIKLAAWQKRPCRDTWRNLQPYIVNLFAYEAQKLLEEGWLRPIGEGIYRWTGQYDELKGIVPGMYDPNDLIISSSTQ